MGLFCEHFTALSKTESYRGVSRKQVLVERFVADLRYCSEKKYVFTQKYVKFAHSAGPNFSFSVEKTK